MKKRKARLTVTVDAVVLRAGNAAVRHGLAQSLSGWVNLALLERAAKERHLAAMTAAVAAYEEEFGTISDAEMASQRREDRRAAITVPRLPTRPRKRRSAA